MEEKRGWVQGEICVWGKAHGERRCGVKADGGRCESGERGRDVSLDLTSDCRLPSQRAGMWLRQ